MSEQRFKCTACGQCCQGWVPLTLDDALKNAHLFPLAMVWSPVSPGNKNYDLIAQLGTTVQLPNKKTIAVLAAPTSYMPPSFFCPALRADNLCSIHQDKPLRCKTMPFYPCREEGDQADLLVPRKGWLCDISEKADLVYKDKKILARHDFDTERAALLAETPLLRSYISNALKRDASILSSLAKTAMNPKLGHFAINFSSFMRLNPTYDMIAFAKKQRPVLQAFAEKTALLPEAAEYHKYYQNTARELEWFARQS